MSIDENKDTSIVKKEDLEKAIGGEITGNAYKVLKSEKSKIEGIKKEGNTTEKDKEAKLKAKVETKPEEPKDTFTEKALEAAAASAIKAAAIANSEIATMEAEKKYFNDKKNYMLNRCKNDEVVTRTVSKLLAPYIGRVYTFLFNGIPVTIYCDDKSHEYPEFIAKKIDEKLAKISDSNTYKEIIDERLNQDTF